MWHISRLQNGLAALRALHHIVPGGPLLPNPPWRSMQLMLATWRRAGGCMLWLPICFAVRAALWPLGWPVTLPCGMARCAIRGGPLARTAGLCLLALVLGLSAAAGLARQEQRLLHGRHLRRVSLSSLVWYRAALRLRRLCVIGISLVTLPLMLIAALLLNRKGSLSARRLPCCQSALCLIIPLGKGS